MNSPHDAVRAEDVLRSAWQELLGVDVVEDGDGFIAQGGNSLLAMRLAHRIEATMGLHLRTADLMRAQTFRKQCELLRRRSTPHTVAPAKEVGSVVRRPLAKREFSGRHEQAPATAAGTRLTRSEQHLWFLHRRHPESSAYNESFYFRLPPDTDLDALKLAIVRTWRETPVLTSTIREVEGVPTRMPTGSNAIRVQHEAPTTEQIAESHLRALTTKPFALSKEVPVRTMVIERAGAQACLVVVIHHIACDLWSIRRLFQRIHDYYAHEVTDLSDHTPASPCPLPTELPSSSPDTLAFWREHLEGIDASVELTADRVSEMHVSAALADSVRAVLDPQESQALTNLGRRIGCTSFSVGLTLFTTLLYRHTGTTAFRIGTPFAQRSRDETRNQVGYRLNMLPLAVRLEPDDTLVATLARIHSDVCLAIDNSEVALTDVRGVAGEADATGEAPFNVSFVHEDNDAPLLALGGQAATELPIVPTHAKFNLTLFMRRRAKVIELVFEYRKDRYERRSISVLLEHLVRLIRAATRAPERTLRDVSRTMFEPEQDRLRSQGTGRPQSSFDTGIYAFFQAASAEFANRPALRSADCTWTYRELIQAVDQVSRDLRDLGIETGQRVAICANPTAEYVVAILGILGNGGSYVPIDPNAPQARRDRILESSGACWLVATKRPTPLRWQDRVPDSFAHGSVSHELGLTWLQVRSFADLADSDRPSSDEAYVMYTSGSTGTPKGVRVGQGAVLHLVRDTDYCELGATTRCLMLAPTAFDASTFEIWGPLLSGGTLIAPAIEALDLDALEQVIREEHVTTLWLTAALFNTIVDLRVGVLAPLRELLIGGEALSVPHVRRAMLALPGTRLINGYGPTEATTFTCTEPINVLPDESARSIPLGLPIAGSSVRIVDDQGTALGTGMPGELAIMGNGLAHGYIDASPATERRFRLLEAGSTSVRAYMTGDLCRWTTDGKIDFLRRMDTQVKLRGQRIELGEIEAAILSHPTANQCCTVMAGRGEGARLVAYVVERQPVQGDESALLDHLRRMLPPYMIPSQVVFLPELPMGATGKIDRAALERRTSLELGGLSRREPPERWTSILLRVWQVTLDNEHVDADTNFFEAGGNSLLAVRLMDRVTQATGKDIPIGRVFAAPTPASMAREIEAAPRRISDDELVQLDEVNAGRTLYCIPGLGGHPVDFIPLAQHLRGRARLVGLQYPTPDALHGDKVSVESYARVLCERLCSRAPQGGYRLAGYSLGGLVAFELTRQLRLAGQHVEQLLLLDSYPNHLQPKSRIQRLHEHLRTALKLPVREIPSYVSVRVGRWIRRRLRQRRATPAPEDPTASSRLSDAIALGRHAAQSYHPTPLTAAVPCTLVRSSHGQSWRQFLRSDPYDQWNTLVPGGLAVLHIDTEHLRLLRDPNVEELALAISNAFDDA